MKCASKCLGSYLSAFVKWSNALDAVLFVIEYAEIAVCVGDAFPGLYGFVVHLDGALVAALVQNQCFFKRGKPQRKLNQPAALFGEQVELAVQLGLDLPHRHAEISQFTCAPELGERLKIVA